MNVQSMKETIDKIFSCAKQLEAMSCNEWDNQCLEGLLVKQESFMKELLLQKRCLQENYGKSWKKKNPLTSDKIAVKLKAIEKFYQRFIQNVSIRKGLIQTELSEINKTKRTLSTVKDLYGGSLKHKKRFNTLL